VDLEGNKDVLALRACAEEDQDGWSCLLQDIRTRGATQMDLIVTDGHEGLLAAVSALFTATPRQRCVVHKQPSAAQRHSPSRAEREINSLPESRKMSANDGKEQTKNTLDKEGKDVLYSRSEVLLLDKRTRR